MKAPLTMAPGPLGGVLTDMALADGTVYVATNNVPVTLSSLSSPAAEKGGGSSSGEVEALSLATGKVEWDTKVPDLPLGAVTVSNDLVVTTLFHGVLIALNRSTGAIVYQSRLPASSNAPIAVAGNAVIVPAGAPETSLTGAHGTAQLVAYTVPKA
jgi:outer membrane protein assembly factor BamB